MASKIVIDTTVELMTPAEVGAVFRVDAKTVTRWAKTGRIPCIRTLGGHRRYRTADVQALLNQTAVYRNDGGAA